MSFQDENDDAMGIPQGFPYASYNENDDAMGIPQGFPYESCHLGNSLG